MGTRGGPRCRCRHPHRVGPCFTIGIPAPATPSLPRGGVWDQRGLAVVAKQVDQGRCCVSCVCVRGHCFSAAPPRAFRVGQPLPSLRRSYRTIGRRSAVRCADEASLSAARTSSSPRWGARATDPTMVVCRSNSRAPARTWSSWGFLIALEQPNNRLKLTTRPEWSLAADPCVSRTLRHARRRERMAACRDLPLISMTSLQRNSWICWRRSGIG
jgi:hypothetical protein